MASWMLRDIADLRMRQISWRGGEAEDACMTLHPSQEKVFETLVNV
jgi:hypothetical protein